MTCHLDSLNMLATPVWIVAPESEELIFANQQALLISKDGTLASMRSGEFSAVAHISLAGYATSLRNGEDIIEIWSLPSDDGTRTLSCKSSPSIARWI